MKKLLSSALALVMALSASAYDFMVDGLCYNYNDDGTSVTLTYENPYGSGSSNYSYLSGDLIIPSSINYNGTTYLVSSINKHRKKAFKHLS